MACFCFVFLMKVVPLFPDDNIDTNMHLYKIETFFPPEVHNLIRPHDTLANRDNHLLKMTMQHLQAGLAESGLYKRI